ncbi:MAG: hypothetical protein DCC58_13500 [Chloroflexi bacterium]|nr:MAG: hypothetical protein DCC58_13500 [Chloroflexota bacterium]
MRECGALVVHAHHQRTVLDGLLRVVAFVDHRLRQEEGPHEPANGQRDPDDGHCVEHDPHADAHTRNEDWPDR